MTGLAHHKPQQAAACNARRTAPAEGYVSHSEEKEEQSQPASGRALLGSQPPPPPQTLESKQRSSQELKNHTALTLAMAIHSPAAGGSHTRRSASAKKPHLVLQQVKVDQSGTEQH